MLFMKGTITEAKCGFSQKAVSLLQSNGVHFGSFDILTDSEVREGLKAYSDWPTFPQLYVDGKLVGGVDVLTEMDEAGDLKALAKESNTALNERLGSLINSAPVMVFMKGTPAEPRCGFSSKLVALLQSHDIHFSSFDILGTFLVLLAIVFSYCLLRNLLFDLCFMYFQLQRTMMCAKD